MTESVHTLNNKYENYCICLPLAVHFTVPSYVVIAVVKFQRY